MVKIYLLIIINFCLYYSHNNNRVSLRMLQREDSGSTSDILVCRNFQLICTWGRCHAGQHVARHAVLHAACMTCVMRLRVRAVLCTWNVCECFCSDVPSLETVLKFYIIKNWTLNKVWFSVPILTVHLFVSAYIVFRCIRNEQLIVSEIVEEKSEIVELQTIFKQFMRSKPPVNRTLQSAWLLVVAVFFTACSCSVLDCLFLQCAWLLVLAVCWLLVLAVCLTACSCSGLDCLRMTACLFDFCINIMPFCQINWTEAFCCSEPYQWYWLEKIYFLLI